MKFYTEDIVELLDGGEVEGFELVKDGDWINEGKIEVRTCVFKTGDKFYRISESRSGSYYTDWYYESEDWGKEVDCTEVVPKEVKVTKWVKA